MTLTEYLFVSRHAYDQTCLPLHAFNYVGQVLAQQRRLATEDFVSAFEATSTAPSFPSKAN